MYRAVVQLKTVVQQNEIAKQICVETKKVVSLSSPDTRKLQSLPSIERGYARSDMVVGWVHPWVGFGPKFSWLKWVGLG